MKKGILLFAVSAFVLAPVFAYGATFRAGSNYYLSQKDTINDNLYSAGGNVNIIGAVNGDAFVAGGSLFLSGPISGDLFAAGGSITVNSNVLGDMRVAGGNILVSNSTGGDLIVAGGQITVAPGATFGKDGAIAGANIIYEGKSGGNLDLKGNSVYIDGTVSGNLSVSGREIKFGPNAVVQGNFDYYSPKDNVVNLGSAVKGSVNFHKLDVPQRRAKGLGFGMFGGIWVFIKSVMLFAAVLVLTYLFKDHVKAITEKSVSSFWKELLRGFIVFIIIPIASILMFITVVGAFLGIITVLLYILLLFITSIISILVFSRIILKYLLKKESYWPAWWVVAIAIIVFSFVSMIPVVGWVFTFAIFLSTLGSLANFVYRKVRGLS